MRDREGGEEPGDAGRASQQLAALLAQRMLAICFWTDDGGITDANDAFLELIGASRDELEAGAIDWKKASAPEHEQRDVEALRQLRATGSCEPYEKEYLRRDGTRVRVLVAGSAIDDHHGVAFVTDITAHRRAEETLRQREHELAEAQHLARMGIWRWDRASDTFTFSDELYQIYGRSPAEIRHTLEGTLELIHPDDRPRVRAARAVDLRDTRPRMYRTVRPSGEVRYLTSTSRPILAGDRFVGLTGVVQDVTERTLAEDELRRSEERFRTLVDRIPVGVMVTNARGEIVLANPAALQISEIELVGTSTRDPAWDVIHDDGTPFPPDEQPVAKAIALRQPMRNVVMGVLRPRLGDRVWLLTSAEPQLGPEGEVRQVVVSFMDISERRGMQARLALADRMVSVGTLAAGVAHEINNPLSYVIANLGYIAHDLDRRGSGLVGAGPLLAALNEAREGADRVRSIVRDLRTFSRGDEDRRGPVDLKRVVDSAISLVWNQIRHAARLTLDVGALPLVLASEARLAQVFVSLLVNAAQAMDERGDGGDANEIRVIGKRDDAGRVVLEFADTGVGIAPEDLKRVFDPFFTTRPLGTGIGLGLSICQGVIGELGGEITVESTLGKGSTFRVILPPLDAVRIAAERPPAAAPTAERGRVLVVDDEEAIGSAIQRMLEDEHDVVYAASGEQALAVLADDPLFDTVLCDLLMPRMSGMDFFARLRQTHPRLAEKTVFLTGGAFTPAAREFLDRTPNRVVEKPFDFDRLRALVAVVVKGE